MRPVLSSSRQLAAVLILVDLSGSEQVGMVRRIEWHGNLKRLNAAGQFIGDIPYPASTVADDHPPFGGVEPASRRLALNAGDEVAEHLVGTYSCRIVAYRPRRAHWFSSLSRPAALQIVTSLASQVFAVPSGCLPTRPRVRCFAWAVPCRRHPGTSWCSPVCRNPPPRARRHLSRSSSLRN